MSGVRHADRYPDARVFERKATRPEPTPRVLAAIADRLDGGGDWRSTNFSREAARSVLDQLVRPA